MVTQAEFDALARKVAFLEKDSMRMIDRVRLLESLVAELNPGAYIPAVYDRPPGSPIPMGGQHARILASNGDSTA